MVYQYDIALSFAEEDRSTALLLKHELDKRGIQNVYYYPDHAQETWGRYLVEQLSIVYAQKARFALVLLSNAYFEGNYTRIEYDAIQMRREQGIDNEYMLLVLIGEDNLLERPELKGLAYIRWQHNPEYIVGTLLSLLEKTKKPFLLNNYFNKSIVNRRILFKGISISLLASVICYIAIYFIESHYNTTEKVTIPAGSYTMGAHNGRKEDMPAHTVKLNAFTISSREVTIAEYRRFCDSTGKKMPPTPDYPYTEKSPVVNVTWQEAADYCAWVKGRLPTEAEWEYAGVKNSNANDRYSGGNNIQLLGYYEKNSGGKAHTGGQKKGGKLGIYDMSGNVAEWCADWYAPYSSIIQDNPLVSDSSSSRKVLRGGHYNSPVQPDPDSNKLSITYRDSEAPNIRKPYIGFRVVWDQ